MHEQTGTKTWTLIELLPTSTHWSQPKQAQTVTFGPIVGWEKKCVAVTSYQEKLDLTHHDAFT